MGGRQILKSARMLPLEMSKTVLVLLLGYYFNPVLSSLARELRELAISNGIVFVGRFEERVADRF